MQHVEGPGNTSGAHRDARGHGKEVSGPGTAPAVPTAGPAGPVDRGDVPGWVLITLMSAGLVVVLWQLAGDQLTSVFEQAIARVTAM